MPDFSVTSSKSTVFPPLHLFFNRYFLPSMVDTNISGHPSLLKSADVTAFTNALMLQWAFCATLVKVPSWLLIYNMQGLGASPSCKSSAPINTSSQPSLLKSAQTAV